MNKLFKLIYVNLLGTFNINQIYIAREDGVKSNLEKKTVITVLIFIFIDYLIYELFKFLSFTNPLLILGIGFFISSITCFIINLSTIDPIIFKSNDTEMLFAMPITRQQILFSKLFTIYLKNLIIVLIIMLPTILSYTSKVGHITDEFGFMYLLHSIIIPFIPMVTSSIIVYIDDYLKTKYHNNIIYKSIKTSIIFVIILLIILILLKLDFSNRDVAITKIINTYIFTYYFTYSLETGNIIVFLTSFLIPFIFIYIFYLIVSNNYLKICSLLKGIKKKVSFTYKKCCNMKRTLGVFKKELLSLFQNKVYLNNSYGLMVLSTIILLFFLKNIDLSTFSNIKFFDIYFYTYLPPILAVLVTISTSSISSFSLEKDNIKMLSTMPLSLEKVIFSKSLVNILIGSIFVIINGLLVFFHLDLPKIEILLCFLYPFISLIFITYTSLLLDIRFIEKTTNDDNTIIKQRMVNLIPQCLSLAIGTTPIFLPKTEQYYLVLGSYLLAMIIILLVEYIYFKIRRQELIKNLLK